MEIFVCTFDMAHRYLRKCTEPDLRRWDWLLELPNSLILYADVPKAGMSIVLTFHKKEQGRAHGSPGNLLLSSPLLFKSFVTPFSGIAANHGAGIRCPCTSR